MAYPLGTSPRFTPCTHAFIENFVYDRSLFDFGLKWRGGAMGCNT